MLVISRNSVFTYRDKPIKTKQVGKDLNVNYVLEGSIQKSGDKLRVTGKLIDATTDHHLWADQYDRKIEDLFAIQDEITMNIVSALQVELTEGEQARLRYRSTDSLQAWSYAVKGYSLFERITKDDNAEARNLFKRAIDTDSDYAWAWTMLGNTYFIDTRYGWHRQRDKSYKESLECAQKALLLDETIPDTYALIGLLKVWKKNYDEAVYAAEKAVSLGPSSAENHAELAMLYRYVGRFEEAQYHAAEGFRQNPDYTFKWEREGSMYKDPDLIEQQIEDLRKAGLTCEGE